MNDALMAQGRSLVAALLDAGKTVSTAESCTGGWIAKVLTDVPGSSAVFGYGIVSYSDLAKASLLGVNPETLAEHGAVSEAVVREMASGVLEMSVTDIAVAVSGIAGPGGGSEEKPVGTVWFAWATDQGVDTERQEFSGDRDAVRSKTVEHALKGIEERLR